MPTLIAALIGALADAAASLVGRVLLALGLQYVTYAGFDTLLAQMMSYALTNFTGLPSTVVGILGLFRVDEALSILSGAVATAMSINGIRSGALTRLVHS